MSAIKKRSAEAERVYIEARVWLDKIEHEQFPRCRDYEEAHRMLQSKICEIVMRRLSEESEPFVKAMVRYQALQLLPKVPPPPALEATVANIRDRWLAVLSELVSLDPQTFA